MTTMILAVDLVSLLSVKRLTLVVFVNCVCVIDYPLFSTITYIIRNLANFSH